MYLSELELSPTNALSASINKMFKQKRKVREKNYVLYLDRILIPYFKGKEWM